MNVLPYLQTRLNIMLNDSRYEAYAFVSIWRKSPYSMLQNLYNREITRDLFNASIWNYP